MKLTSPTAEGRTIATRCSVYRIYGVALASNIPFANRLIEDDGRPQVTFTCRLTPPSDPRTRGELIYESPYRLESGESNYRLYRVPNGHLMRFAEVVDFYIYSDRIVCHLLDPAYRHVVEILLLGTVLCFWLELRKVPMLHASVVVDGNRAVAFLADKKGGKSSLAASMMQLGRDLLSDDILPVRCTDETCYAEPGYPQMRMWPQQAKHYLGRYDHLDLVDPALSKRRIPVGGGGLGRFCDRPKPLSCIYIPSRRDADEGRRDVEIQPVAQSEALIELMRNSFIPNTVEAIGLQPQRMRLFSRILSQVAVRRLAYPSGMEHMPRTCRAVLDDLTHLAS